MVIVLHQAEDTLAAFKYNEKKVEQKHAKFFHSRNTNAANAFVYSKDFRFQLLKNIEDKNLRVKNKCLHISVNPTKGDLLKMTGNDLRNEMDRLMKRLGYENQPYFIYKHEDIERTHFHIVSTRIDVNTLKKISDSNEKRKVNSFIQELAQKYHLDNTQKKNDSVNLIPNAQSPDLMASVQEVFKILNSSNISSAQEYKDILKAFNLELYESGKGKVVLVKDKEGNSLRHSIKVSDFKERPDLDFSDKPQIEKNQELQKTLQDKTKQVLKELIQEYRFFTEQELRKTFLRNNLIPYQVSKNGNYNIFSPNDKTVVDAQFLIKKYSIRLKGFVLSNDGFYAIVRDYTDQLLTNNRNLVEALLDKEKSIINNDSKNNKISLKALDLSISEEYNIVSKLDKNAKNELKKALESHFEYLLNRAVNSPQKQQTHEFHQMQNISLMERINRQFLFELMNYWRKGNYRQRYDRSKRKRLNKSKGKQIRY
ncbi:relaxase/mobilization nuclease domain-containing protein [Saccharicrinis sp. GN24d3]|uniref:relaxase/mobilization nuclease domain-containing protein n=1 Tax=Saccharicrinis sp. GN24d3 TaxID=3458416 RepID=UPI004035D729